MIHWRLSDRRSFAAQNTWQKRYETIIRKLENQQEIELLSSELAGKQRDLEAKQDRIESLSPEAAKAERSLKILSEAARGERPSAQTHS